MLARREDDFIGLVKQYALEEGGEWQRLTEGQIRRTLYRAEYEYCLRQLEDALVEGDWGAYAHVATRVPFLPLLGDIKPAYSRALAAAA